MTRDELRRRIAEELTRRREAALEGSVLACDALRLALPQELLEELAKHAHRAREARRRR